MDAPPVILSADELISLEGVALLHEIIIDGPVLERLQKLRLVELKNNEWTATDTGLAALAASPQYPNPEAT